MQLRAVGSLGHHDRFGRSHWVLDTLLLVVSVIEGNCVLRDDGSERVRKRVFTEVWAKKACAASKVSNYDNRMAGVDNTPPKFVRQCVYLDLHLVVAI